MIKLIGVANIVAVDKKDVEDVPDGTCVLEMNVPPSVKNVKLKVDDQSGFSILIPLFRKSKSSVRQAEDVFSSDSSRFGRSKSSLRHGTEVYVIEFQDSES